MTTPSTLGIDRHVQQVQRRLVLKHAILSLGRALFVVALLAAIAVALRTFAQLHLPRPMLWLYAALAISMLVALILGLRSKPAPLTAAAHIDDALGLKEKFGTAMYVRNGPMKDDPFARLAVSDAENAAVGVDLRGKFPLEFPKPLIWASIIALAAFLAGQFIPPLDLFGRQQAQQIAIQLEQQQEQAKKTVEDALTLMNQAPTSVAGDEEIQLAKNQLQEMLQQPGLEPDKANRTAAAALQQLDDSLKKEIANSSTFAQAKQNERMLRQLGQTDEKGPVADAKRELAEGNLDKAVEKLNEVAKNFDTMSDEEKQQAANQMQQMANQLQQLANDPKAQQQMQQQLQQQLGVNQQQAQQMVKQMQQAAQGDPQAQQQLQQQMQQAMQQMPQAQQQAAQQAIQQAQAQANSQQNAQQMQQAAQQMAQAMQQGQQGQQQQGQQQGQQAGQQQAGQQQAQGQQTQQGQQGQQQAGQQQGQQAQGQQQGQQAQGQQQGQQQGMQQAQQDMKNAIDQMQAMQKDMRQVQAQQQQAQQQAQNAAGQCNGGQPGQKPGPGQAAWKPGEIDNKPGQGMGGAGQGMGGQAESTPAPFGFKDEISKSQDNEKGRILASSFVKADQLIGESTAGLREVIQSNVQDSADEIDRQRIGRQAANAVRDYFKTLGVDAPAETPATSTPASAEKK